MKGFLLDASTVSSLLVPEHPHHQTTVQRVDALDPEAVRHVCAITYGELHYGYMRAKAESREHMTDLQNRLQTLLTHRPLEVSEHTAEEYAGLKAKLARRVKHRKQKTPRWVEDWIDEATAQKLQIDENDLWVAAVSLERDLTLLSGDEDMAQLPLVEPRLRLINTRT